MRLIDADALIERLKKDNPQTSKLKWAQIVVDNAPTIDIAEVCGECNPYTPCIYCKHEFENKFERKEP